MQSTLEVEAKQLSPAYRATKRAFDIVSSLICLLVLLPLFIAVALAVRLTSKGPVFYASTRVGLQGKPFRFLKFRSMYMDAHKRLQELQKFNEREGPIFKMRQDPRVTPIGRFMRRYSLDELPQLLHVLSGQMSMVGPRPPIPSEVEKYDCVARGRLAVKPGITCYWQVMGRSDLTFDEWIELDLRYIEKMCLWEDLVILVKTPRAVLLGKGAY